MRCQKTINSASWCCGIWNAHRPISSTSSPSSGWSRPAPSPAPPSGWACPSRCSSRRVARLEEQLGARLLTRTARGAQPTEIGQAYYARAADILAELEAAQEVVAEAVTQIAGPIRLTAPLSFGVAHLAPGAGRVRRRCIRRSSSTSSSRTALSIWSAAATTSRSGSAGSPIPRWSRAGSRRCARHVGRKPRLSRPRTAGRSGPPTSPATTSCSTRNEQMALPGRRPLGDGPRRSRVMRTNNGDMLRAAAEAGLGICLLPSFIAAPAIEDGSVEVAAARFSARGRRAPRRHAARPRRHRPGPRAGRFPGRALRPRAGLGSVLAGAGASGRWTRRGREALRSGLSATRTCP